jgi:hypothetical protein
MKLRLSLGTVGLGLLLCACGVGKDANVGSDSNKHLSADGGGAGGSSNGGDTGSGASQSTGGAVTGSGGASHATGGATQGSGGSTTQATGGATHGSGGSTMQATGGSTHGTGGSSGGVACGKNTCSAGEICCSASCGICGPRGGACPAIVCQPPPPIDAGRPCIDNVACIKGTAWSSTQCKCVPTTTGGTCATAADCHLVSNYCDSCNCLSLASGEKEPVCSGTTVQCLIDPCSTKSAACVSGHCVAQ